MQPERPHHVPIDLPTAAADVTVTAASDNVPRLRRAATRAARWLGADEQTVTRVALAVSEASSNAVLHAFPATPGHMRVIVSDRAGDVEVRVSDDGIGLTPRSDSPGLGLGLGLIAEVSDDLAIRRLPHGGTEIIMRFAPRPGS